MRLLSIFILSVLLSLLITGCSTVTPGKGVRIWQQDEGTKQWYVGNAAIVSHNRIVTANHVVDLHNRVSANISKHSWMRKWKTFKVKKKVLSRHEPYVFLECKDFRFKDSYIFKIGKGKPYKAITHRGTFKWKNYRPKMGDSGSPVVNKSGELIGVVYGYRFARRDPLFIPILHE